MLNFFELFIPLNGKENITLVVFGIKRGSGFGQILCASKKSYTSCSLERCVYFSVVLMQRVVLGLFFDFFF